MPIHTADRSGPPETRRAKTMGLLHKVARIVANNPEISDAVLDQADAAIEAPFSRRTKPREVQIMR
ncbi:MAG: hypothetical protein U0487_03390 [Patescibacteria group bacterium]